MNRQKPLSSKWPIAAAAMGVIVLALVMFGPLSGQDARVLITQAIDENNLVTLFGNTRPEARARQTDRGPVPDGFPMTYMELQLRRPHYLQQQFEAFLNEQTTKGAPNYQHWITQEDLGATYGLAQQDVDTIKSWLQSKGFTIDRVLPSRMVIAFSGTAGQVRDAFHTEIHYLDVGGVQHYANIRDEQIPAALAPAVVGIVSLHDFMPRPMAVRRPDYTFSGCATTTHPTEPGTCYALVPADFQTIYNITPLHRLGLTGAGQVIAVVEDSDTYNSQADVTSYRNAFLSKYSGTVSTVHPGCTDPGATNGASGAESEADLDAEVAGIAAPNAKIVVAACANTATFGGLIAIQNYGATDYPTNLPTIFSMSYGTCEAVNGATANAAYSSAYSSVNASGVAVFVSTGDGDSSDCSQGYVAGYWGVGVSGFASTAYNVAMGGTDFEDTYNVTKAGATVNQVPLSTYWNSTNEGVYGSAKSYVPEIPWNDSCASYLITTYVPGSYTTSYGSSGFCNNTNVLNANNASYGFYNSSGGAGGGPSGCWTGVPSNNENPYSAADGAYVSGTCAGNPKPTFQSNPLGNSNPIYGNPADGVRDIPDVSLFASSGIWGHYVVICYSDTSNNSGGTSCAGAPSTWSGFGGTSISTPVMAGIQALINQKWGTTWLGGTVHGNPLPVYYTIAANEYGTTGNSACYSINQLSLSRRGITPNCPFYDITQGDINANCQAVWSNAAPCYNSGGTNGVVNTTSVSAIYPATPGSGYSGTPTCTIAAPSNKNSYLSPSGGTLWAGGTQATCTATVATTSTTASATANANGGYLPGAGMTFQVGATTYKWVSGTPVASSGNTVNVEIPTSATEANIALNLAAAINANTSCGAPTGSSCYGSGTQSNASATASVSSTTVTVTAKTTGCNGVAFWQNYSAYTSANVVFALSSTTGYLTGGSVSGQICSYTVTTAGSGYTGNPTCTVSGNGSGATCNAQIALATAPGSYQPAWGATPGWDFATGIGSVNAYNLVLNSNW